MIEFLDNFEKRDGAGVAVAVLDSGVSERALREVLKQNGQELADNQIVHFKLRRENKKPVIFEPSEEADKGHGTAVAYQILRVAPQAQIYSLQVSGSPEDREGNYVMPEAIVLALQYLQVLVRKNQQTVDIINMSMGFPYPDYKSEYCDRSRINTLFEASRLIDLITLRGIPVVVARSQVANKDLLDRLSGPFHVDSLMGEFGLDSRPLYFDRERNLFIADHGKVPDTLFPEWKSKLRVSEGQVAKGSSYAAPIATGLLARLIQGAREAGQKLTVWEMKTYLMHLTEQQEKYFPQPEQALELTSVS